MFPRAAVTQLDPEVPEMEQGKITIMDALSSNSVSQKQKSSLCSLLRNYLGTQFIATKIDESEKESRNMRRKEYEMKNKNWHEFPSVSVKVTTTGLKDNRAIYQREVAQQGSLEPLLIINQVTHLPWQKGMRLLHIIRASCEIV